MIFMTMMMMSETVLMLRCTLSQETFILVREAIVSVVDAKVAIIHLRLDHQVALDIAAAAAGGGEGMTQWFEQTSHPKLRE